MMRKWKMDENSFAKCRCDELVEAMSFTMKYTNRLECIGNDEQKEWYGEYEDYDLTTQLKCSCGRVYKECEDYTVNWEEDDNGWIWTLVVETE